jgi:hypothetical protein
LSPPAAKKADIASPPWARRKNPSTAAVAAVGGRPLVFALLPALAFGPLTIARATSPGYHGVRFDYRSGCGCLLYYPDDHIVSPRRAGRLDGSPFDHSYTVGDVRSRLTGSPLSDEHHRRLRRTSVEDPSISSRFSVEGPFEMLAASPEIDRRLRSGIVGESIE